MPSVSEVTHWVENARTAPVRPWLEYHFESIPFAVYDDDVVAYVNHPSPPAARPDRLVAATAVEIGGVQTATLPTWVCDSHERAVTIAYHEGFHVYQAHHFVPTPADMFTAMAHYPELVPEYRALCRIEADLLNDRTRPAAERLAVLGALLRHRRARYISEAGGLLDYERYLERFEGTASYVEQATRHALFGIEPGPVIPEFGWTRFYQAGAALCRLMDETHTSWMERIEAGESPSDIVIGSAAGDLDLSALGWDDALDIERAAVAALRPEIDALTAPLEASGLVIEYPAGTPVFRAFSPNTMQPLGDGRILHREMFKLMLPDRGHVASDGVPAIDDIAHRRAIVPARAVEYHAGVLRVDADGVDIALNGVTRLDDGAFRIDS
ncbi:MAG: hypothetical protein IPM16_21620 [Chloroflexi bacterium]|nr:hypothetical protein [Chloroflexota bacterium]